MFYALPDDNFSQFSRLTAMRGPHSALLTWIRLFSFQDFFLSRKHFITFSEVCKHLCEHTAVREHTLAQKFTFIQIKRGEKVTNSH